MHAAQKAESRGFVFRVRSAVADLIERAPGLRSVLGPLQKLAHLDPSVRHTLEREALTRRHSWGKLDIAREKRTPSRVEVREKVSLQKVLKKAARQARKVENKVGQEFYEVASDQGLWRKRNFKDGEATIEATNDLRNRVGLGALSLERKTSDGYTPFYGEIDFALFGTKAARESLRAGLA